MRSEAGDRWIQAVLGIAVAPPLAPAGIADGGEEGNPFKNVKDWAARRKAAKQAKRSAPDPSAPSTSTASTSPPTPLPLTPEQQAAQLQRKLQATQAFGNHQKALAERKYQALDDAAQENMNILYDATASQEERNFLQKALASGHTVDEIAAFAEEIRGKDADWMRDNLLLTGDSRGKGIQQQYVMSCQATTVQSVKGMLDPIYALSVRKATADVSAIQTTPDAMAAEQKALLETVRATDGYKGEAKLLADYKADSSIGIGKGRGGNDLLNAQSSVTGVTYAVVRINNPTEREAAVNDIAAKLAEGLPVPLSVGGAPGELMHYVLAVAADPGPPASFYIHDPGTGDTVVRTEAQLKSGAMALPSGWNYLNKYEQPTITP